MQYILGFDHHLQSKRLFVANLAVLAFSEKLKGTLKVASKSRCPKTKAKPKMLSTCYLNSLFWTLIWLLHAFPKMRLQANFKIPQSGSGCGFCTSFTFENLKKSNEAK